MNPYVRHNCNFTLLKSLLKEYVPGGRQTILRHPESVANQQLINNQTVEGESILLKKFSQVNISGGSPVSIIASVISMN